MNRLGRKTRLSEEQRKLLWTIFEAVWAGLGEQGLITTAGMFNVLARTSQAAQHRRSTSPWSTKPGHRHCPTAVSGRLGGRRPNGLFFAGDLGQRIFQQPFSWKAAGADVRGRSTTLKINYRTSHQIRAQADRLLDPQIADVDGNVEEPKDTVSLFNGPNRTSDVCNRRRRRAKAWPTGFANWPRKGFSLTRSAICPLGGAARAGDRRCGSWPGSSTGARRAGGDCARARCR